jgi:hypothetical protein
MEKRQTQKNKNTLSLKPTLWYNVLKVILWI